ncbi:MAG: phosphatidylcholine/phosphatidylserine synthase [Alphaproteobacteria bacterium]|nr:phosphatidylcholine/phosphatidylserine synthase [Alphaproteobacteria bacterium]
MKKQKNSPIRTLPTQSNAAKVARWKEKWKSPSIGRILPNMITLSALCMGLSSIQYGFSEQWRNAVASVLIAGVLDGLDGRVARLLKSSSAFGAELDSLVDFINFGVAPALITYCYSLSVWGNRGWGLSLFFTACMAWRLARFNTMPHHSSVFSMGVPAPAGALLLLTPMIVTFVFDTSIPVWMYALVMIATSILTISRYPTFVFKKMVIAEHWFGVFCMTILAIIAGLFSAPWETLLILSVLYMAFLPISGYWFYSDKRR